MIADYYLVRRQQLIVDDLYAAKGIYNFSNGFNRRALLALLLGILPNIPGFLVTIKVVSPEAVPAWITQFYSYAWFVGFFVSGTTYYIFMRSYTIISTGTNKQEINYVTAD